MKRRKTLIITLVIFILIGFLGVEFVISQESTKSNQQEEDTITIEKLVILEEKNNYLVEKNKILAKDNKRLKKELERLRSLREELIEELEWYIDLSEATYNPEKTKSFVKDKLEHISRAINNFNTEELAEYVHPARGVRFSPSEMITKSHLIFSKEEVENFKEDQHKYTWGLWEGSGTDISLTPKGYFDKFINNIKFSKCKLRYNNLSENFGGNHYIVYPNSVVVEYLYKGTEKLGYVDRRALRIVFQEYNDGEWYIVGIISCHI